MSTQHNESLAEKASTNGNVEDTNVKPGFEFHISVSRNVAIGAPIALLAGVVLGKAFKGFNLASAASKTSSVAETVEEAATRG